MIFYIHILKTTNTVVTGSEGKALALGLFFFFSHSFTAADLMFLSAAHQVHIPAQPLPFTHFKAPPLPLSMASYHPSA